MKMFSVCIVLSLTGCLAERPVEPAHEPDWSYHDGPEPNQQSVVFWERFDQEPYAHMRLVKNISER